MSKNVKRFIIHPQDSIRRENARVHIGELDPEKKWVVEIKEFQNVRSLEQNAYLHGVALKMICDHTGYEQEDMKTYLLGEFTGWVEYEMMGNPRKRPVKRSHELKVAEMAAFMEYIWWWASDTLDLNIPAPNEGGKHD